MQASPSRSTTSGKADVNSMDAYGVTPLYAAIDVGDPKRVKSLLGQGADPNLAHGINHQPPLCYASQEKCNAEIVRLLIAHGANVNGGDQWNTPLICCSLVANAYPEQALASARILLEHGADKTRRSQEGKTAYEIAREMNHRDLADLLR